VGHDSWLGIFRPAEQFVQRGQGAGDFQGGEGARADAREKSAVPRVSLA